MMRWALLSLLLLSACEAGSHPESWRLEDGTTIDVDLGEPAEREERDERVAYRLESGLTVALQQIPVEGGAASQERTPRSVAQALADRLELGEREGELLHGDCHLAAVEAECLDGRMTLDGREHARHGAVFLTGDQIVWLDVSGPAGADERVRLRARSVLESIRFKDEQASDG